MNLDTFKERAESYTDELLLTFVKEMSKTISRNWVINSKIDRNIFTILQDDHGVEYKETLPGTPVNDMEDLIYIVLNYGYITGENRVKISMRDQLMSFVDVLRVVSEHIDVSEVSKSKIIYEGPDITSCSITSTSYDIKQTLHNIGKTDQINEE